MNLAYLTVNSAKSYNFYMIPKELIDSPVFDNIDYGSKLLYALMLNRASLSANNSDFIDVNGKVYIIYTVEQVMESMRCSKPTAIKMLKQLDDIGLILKKRQGQGKPSLLYVMDFSTANSKLPIENNDINFKKSKMLTSQSQKNKPSEVKNIDPSHTNQNQTDSSYTKSIDSAESENQLSENESVASSDFYDSANKAINPIVNLNILDNLNPKYSDRQPELSEIREIFADIQFAARINVRVGKQDIRTYVVKEAFSRLTSRHIEYVLDSLAKKNKSSDKIKNTKAYLLTALFNAASAVLPVDTDFVKETVRKNIDLDFLLRRYPDKTQQAHLQELFNIIVEVLISRRDSFRIARGEFFARDVKKVFVSLTSEHVESVLNAISTNTTEVKSVKAYIQTSLWNSFYSSNIGTTFDVNNLVFNNFGISPKSV